LNPIPHPGWFVLRLDNWSSGSGEDLSMTPSIFIIVIISPLKRTQPFFFNNLEFPSPKDNWC
jgi:hypothetical protein